MATATDQEFAPTIKRRKPAPPPLAHRLPAAAAVLGVSRQTLWRWREKGIVRTVTIGGVVLFARSELRRVLREREGQS